MTNYYKKLKLNRESSLVEIHEQLTELEKKWQRREITDPIKANEYLVIIGDARKVFETEDSRSKYDSDLDYDLDSAGSGENSKEKYLGQLSKKAKKSLEDKDWSQASTFCEEMLDLSPDCGQAYLYKLFAEYKTSSYEELENLGVLFADSSNYENAVNNLSEDEAKKLKQLADTAILSQIDREKENIYQQAKKEMETGDKKKAIKLFKQIPGYKDAGDRIDEIKYIAACVKMNTCEDADGARAAKKEFEELKGYKDSSDKVKECEKIAEEFDTKKKKKNTIIAVIIGAIVLVIAFMVLYSNVIKPYTTYTNAVDLMNQKKYQEAYSEFEKTNWGDTEQKKEELSKLMIAEGASLPGEVITFGKYEQDGNLSNGAEPIEWVTIKKEGNKSLVLSKYALDKKMYSDSKQPTTWASSSLRQWISGTFYKNAFTDDEKSKILDTTLQNPNVYKYDTTKMEKTTETDNNQPQTVDKVFCMSEAEIETYIPDKQARRCIPTKYAKANGLWTDSKNDNCCMWWTRSNSARNQDAAYRVQCHGWIYVDAAFKDGSTAGFRPAMWIETE